MRQAFWKGRHVLITGHTGFKGAWLTLLLKRLGASVTGFALAPERKQDLFEVANVRSALHLLSMPPMPKATGPGSETRTTQTI